LNEVEFEMIPDLLVTVSGFGG